MLYLITGANLFLHQGEEEKAPFNEMAAKSREDYKIALAKYKANTTGDVSKVSQSKSAEMSDGSDGSNSDSDEGSEGASDDE